MKCALLVANATAHLGDERSASAVEQLVWALQAQKGLTAEAAAAVAEKLLRH